VNFAIVECLEGSEREDELVANQMQQALEAGQLDRVSEMLGILPETEIKEEDSSTTAEDKNNDDKSDESTDDNDDFYKNLDLFDDENSC
jgi:hypothetical protein